MSGESRRAEAPQGPPWSLDLLADLHAGVLDGPTADELRRQVEADPEAREIMAALDATMAAADPSDFEGLGKLAAQKSQLQEQVDELELRWLELGEALE